MPKLWDIISALGDFRQKNALPEVPGVYFFLDREKRPLYIGKATALRDRVKSYFSRTIVATRGPKIVRMLEQVSFVAYRETDSVLEAFILEAALIKAYQPPYNTDAKDDKSYQCVVITREAFPRVLIVRGRNIFQEHQGYRHIFGPFPSACALREALKIIRKLFPFRDKCVPYIESRDAGRKKNVRTEKPCFSAQIGLCPGVCVGAVSVREYARTINHIRLFFAGRKSALIKTLEREMQAAAEQLTFERASVIKKTLFGLRHIQDMALMKNESGIGNDESGKGRIEAYDVAHLGGNASVGVMVVLKNGRPAKAFYRQFILRGEHNSNDLTALTEILTRRWKHREWKFPDMIVVDGGEPQVQAAKRSLTDLAVSPLRRMTVVGVVKNAKHRPERLIGPETLTRRLKREILLANSEAHRFALTFHRKRRAREFLSA